MAEVQAVVEHVSDRTRPDRRLEHMVTNDITYLDKPGVFVIDPQYGAEEQSQRARLKHLFTQRLSPLLQAAQLIQGRAPDAWRRLKA